MTAIFLRFINILNRLRLPCFKLCLNFKRNDNYHKSILSFIDNNFLDSLDYNALMSYIYIQKS